MNTKVSLNTHQVSLDQRRRCHVQMSVAMDIHNLFAKFSVGRFGEERSIREQFLDFDKKGRPVIGELVSLPERWDEVESMIASATRMTSSMRISLVADHHVLLSCRWAGRSNEALGEIAFCVSTIHIVVSHISAEYIKHFKVV